MLKKITSLANARIKNVVGLRQARRRKEQRLTLVEGCREVACAFGAGAKVEEIYVCTEIIKDFPGGHPLGQKCLSSGRPIFDTTKEVFSKISYGERNEGILIVCALPETAFHDIADKDEYLFIIVEGVEKPGNLGAILRTSEAAGADGVFICGGQTDLYNPNTIRASLGAIFSVKVISGHSEEAYRYLKEKKVKVYAACPNADMIYTEADFRGSVAIVVGSEQEGLSDFWLKNSFARIKIPLKGEMDSLNVSTSAAVLLYEAVRQRDYA